MTILAFGCSVAHGAETVYPYTHEENIPFSYPGIVSQKLNVECENWAFCGNSNENIFHTALETIPKYEKITAVIIGWTSPVREVWKCEDRYWQFIPSWCYTNDDLLKPISFYKEPKINTPTTPRVCSDQEEYVSVLEKFYDMLMRYKFDRIEYTKKRNNYVLALRTYCKSNNIKLIETFWSNSAEDEDVEGVTVDLSEVGPWLDEGRHPTKEEHELIAKMIIGHYKL
jgi:hypothetical protein